MTRTMRPLTANVGGVEIYISTDARRRIRKRARQAAVIGGYAAGVAGATMAAVAIAQSSLLLPMAVCGAVAGVVVWRCRG